MHPSHWFAAAVLVLGLASLGMQIWIDAINQQQRARFALANMVMDLRTRLATAHLWLEEGLTSSNERELARAQDDLAGAERLSQLLLHGGSSGDLTARPVLEPDLRSQALEIAQRLAAWDRITRLRITERLTSGEDALLARRNDDVLFDDIQERAARLATSVERSVGAAHRDSRRLILGILLLWSGVVVASVTGLWQRERRRRQAEESLQRAKETLEEAVAQRTSALRTLNDDLAHELEERLKSERMLREQERQLRWLSDQLLAAQETERARVSRELHDELGHTLVAMKLELGYLRRRLSARNGTASASLAMIGQTIDGAIEDVRRLCQDLRPSMLQDLGLTAALKALVERCGAAGEDGVCPSLAEIDHLLPQDAQLVLYRIAQEAVTNARKHARARRLSLSVQRQADRLSLVVEDDGAGFDPREASGRGLGLATMRERALMLGAQLDIESAAGRGTRVQLTLPLTGRAGH